MAQPLSHSSCHVNALDDGDDGDDDAYEDDDNDPSNHWFGVDASSLFTL